MGRKDGIIEDYETLFRQVGKFYRDTTGEGLTKNIEQAANKLMAVFIAAKPELERNKFKQELEGMVNELEGTVPRETEYMEPLTEERKPLENTVQLTNNIAIYVSQMEDKDFPQSAEKSMKDYATKGVQNAAFKLIDALGTYSAEEKSFEFVMSQYARFIKDAGVVGADTDALKQALEGKVHDYANLLVDAEIVALESAVDKKKPNESFVSRINRIYHRAIGKIEQVEASTGVRLPTLREEMDTPYKEFQTKLNDMPLE